MICDVYASWKFFTRPTPHTPWKFLPLNPPPPRNFHWPSVGGGGIDIFWNHTLLNITGNGDHILNLAKLNMTNCLIREDPSLMFSVDYYCQSGMWPDQARVSPLSIWEDRKMRNPGDKVKWALGKPRQRQYRGQQNQYNMQYEGIQWQFQEEGNCFSQDGKTIRIELVCEQNLPKDRQSRQAVCLMNSWAFNETPNYVKSMMWRLGVIPSGIKNTGRSISFNLGLFVFYISQFVST